MCSYPCTLPPSFLYSRQPRHGSLSSENASCDQPERSGRVTTSNDPTRGWQIIHHFTFGKVTREVFWISNRDFSVSFYPLCLYQVSLKHIHWALAWSQKPWTLDSCLLLDRYARYHAQWFIDIFVVCGKLQQGLPVNKSHKSQQFFAKYSFSCLVSSLYALHLCRYVSGYIFVEVIL